MSFLTCCQGRCVSDSVSSVGPSFSLFWSFPRTLAAELWFVHLRPRPNWGWKNIKKQHVYQPSGGAGGRTGLRGQILQDRQNFLPTFSFLFFSSSSPSFLHHMGILSPHLIKGWRAESWSSQRWGTWPLRENTKKKRSFIHVVLWK